MVIKQFFNKFPTHSVLVLLLTAIVLATGAIPALGQVTNLPNGVSTVTRASLFGYLTEPTQSKNIVFFDDFLVPSTGDYINHRAYTTINTPTAAIGTDGSLQIEADYTDGNWELWRTATIITLESGKKTWFAARLKCSQATDCIITAGLYDVAGMATVTSASSATACVMFQVDDDDASIDFRVLLTSTTTATTTTAVGTLTADTYVTMGWYYDGDTEIKIFVDDVHVGTSAVTYIPTTPLCAGFGVHNGKTADPDGGPALNLDYLLVCKER